MAYTIQKAFDSQNLVEFFDDQKLQKLGAETHDFVQSDLESRKEWADSQKDWLKLAAQVRETKSYPWDGAANVKYPLMTIASMQFHARALPGLLPNDRPVKVKAVGTDKSFKKQRRAERVSKYMSWQVLEDMETWVDDFDRLLLVLPIVGLAYRKSYYSVQDDKPRSSLLLPNECIVNYHATSYERARITHVVRMDPNELIELQRAGVFADVELSEPVQRNADAVRDETLGMTHGNTQDDPYELYEVHHCWDLDGDGYKEPYIVTIEAESQKVLRIVPRWLTDSDVVYTPKNEVARIKPVNYFTVYRFIPDPNSSVYGIGLGTLLGPTNEAVNSLINQLIDAGSLSNLQGGFLSRGAKIKGGATRFRPGEWKIVNSSAEDLSRSIVPMPVKEPSGTLFNLLTFLVNAGERVSSVSDMMVGDSPGQNQPATTTMAVLEQGLKVFNSIYKRIHRSLGQEFKQLFSLNYQYLSDDKYKQMLDAELDMSQFGGQQPTPEQLQQIQQQLEAENRIASVEADFTPQGMDVVPTSDPNMASDAMKLLRANALMEKLAAGVPLNPAEVTRRVLQAEGHEDIDVLMTLPPPQPSLDEKELDLKVLKEQRDTISSQYENLAKKAQAIYSIAQAEAAEEGAQLNTYHTIAEDMMKMIDLKSKSSAGPPAQ